VVTLRVNLYNDDLRTFVLEISLLRKWIHTESQRKGETSVSCHRPSTCRSHMRTGVSLTPVRADKSHVRRWWRNMRPVMSGVSFTSWEWDRGWEFWMEPPQARRYPPVSSVGELRELHSYNSYFRVINVINKHRVSRCFYCASFNFYNLLQKYVIQVKSKWTILSFVILFIFDFFTLIFFYIKVKEKILILN